VAWKIRRLAEGRTETRGTHTGCHVTGMHVKDKIRTEQRGRLN